jgi:hypothetical protein
MMSQEQQAQGKLPRPTAVLLSGLENAPADAVTLHAWSERTTGSALEPVAFHRVLAELEKHGQVEGEQTDGPLRCYSLTARGQLDLEQASRTRQEQRFRTEVHTHRHGRKDRSMQLVLWILRLYPQSWRERYTNEMVALLEQHTITLWTVIDLLFGVLDARLDPYYRRARPVVAWRGLARSWKLLLTAMIAFWLILGVPAYGVENLSPSFPLYWLTTPWNVGMFLSFFTWLAYISLCPIFAVLVGWIGWQGGKHPWMLLRLLPVALFFLLFFFYPVVSVWRGIDGWRDVVLQVVDVAALMVNAHTLATMCTSFKRWENMTSLWLAWGIRVCALFLLVGMALLSFTQLQNLPTIWQALQDASAHTPLPANMYLPRFLFNCLSLGFAYVMPTLATLLAFLALVRSVFALKTTRLTLSPQAVPKQEPLSSLSVSHDGQWQEQEPARAGEQLSQLSLAKRRSARVSQQDRVSAKAWLMIGPLLAFALSVPLIEAIYANTNVNAIFIGYATGSPIHPLLVLLLLAGCLAGIPLAIAVRKARRQENTLPEQGVLPPQVQIIQQEN